MDLATLIPVAIVVTLCSLLQSLVGFGFALFAVPLLILLGLSLPEAVGVCLTATLTQGAVAAIGLRRHIQWRAIAPVTTLFILATPLGLAAMGLLVGMGAGRVKQGVGIMLLAVLLLWWLVRVEPRERLAAGWGMAAGVGAGFLTGSVGMGGPPCVLWVLGHRWSGEQMRASLLTIYSIGAPLQFGMLWWGAHHRPEVGGAGLLGLLLTPLIIAGSAAGLRLAPLLPVTHLRRVMLLLLAGMALYAIVTPIVTGLVK